jgi:hypothetical protein
MECTNLVDPHQLLCPWFTVVFVLFCIYTSNVSLEEQIWLTECIYLADYFKQDEMSFLITW